MFNCTSDQAKSNTDKVKDIVAACPTLSNASIVVGIILAGSRSMFFGYLYNNKKFGIITVTNYANTPYTVKINNEVYSETD